MKILNYCKEDMEAYGKEPSSNVFSIHVVIDDVNAKAEEMITVISDKSWINKLDAVGKAAFDATSERTIEKLVHGILSKVNNNVTADFGEFMVSYTAQDSLELKCGHKHIPLAELLKERVTGNGGFDFHTESDLQVICFGEAKFSGVTSPYNNALSQMVDFIGDKKDVADTIILGYFASPEAIKNSLNGQRGYVAAFSINDESPRAVIEKALKSKWLDTLLEMAQVIYLIGVEVRDA